MINSFICFLYKSIFLLDINNGISCKLISWFFMSLIAQKIGKILSINAWTKHECKVSITSKLSIVIIFLFLIFVNLSIE